MKLIIPMAGKGERLKPHTHTTPKALIHVAGKPLLEHLLDSLSSLNFEKAIFIVDKHYPELEKLIKKNYKYKPVFILQKERKGVAHAIYGAKNHAKDDDLVILFADTLIETELKTIKNLKHDGIIWTKQVNDPRQFGVTFETNGIITKLIEKPETPVSDKAIVGLYYFKHGDKLFEAVEYLINNNIKTKEEYQLTDALQYMIRKGERLVTKDVKLWQDCGTVPNLLETNRYLLKKRGSKVISTKNSVIIKPVYIENGADITNSIIGPNVSIGKEAVINNSIVSDSVINEAASLKDVSLSTSIIGNKTIVKGQPKKLSLGDSSEVHHG